MVHLGQDVDTDLLTVENLAKLLQTQTEKGININEERRNEGRGFESDLLSCTIHLEQKHGTISMDKNETWPCYLCCNPAKGRVDIEERS